MRRALVHPDLPEWADAIAATGAHVTPLSEQRAPESLDLAVAPAEAAATAAASEARTVVLEGIDAVGPLVAAGYRVERFVPLPSPEAPSLFLPLDRPRPARYALDRLLRPATRLRQARNLVAVPLLARGRLRPRRPIITVGVRGPRTGPRLLVAARELGVAPDADWLLAPAGGDPLSRAVFHVFPPKGRRPTLVLKFARVPGYSDSFDRDERGLELARSAGPVVARQAPRWVGRFDLEGVHASVETAAAGERLISFLHTPRVRRTRVAALEGVADWLVEVARSTRAPGPSLAPEIARLRDEVLPHYAPAATPALLDGLDPLPGVLQHNDLGSWNLVVTGKRDFVALDWESARRHGLPLWDVSYFLTDALAELDGAGDPDAREAHFARLFRGDLPDSPLLFRWIRRAVEASAVPPDLVGPILTLGFLHHGVSRLARGAALERHAGSAVADRTPFHRRARRWLEDPALGPSWARWRTSS